MNKIVKLTQHFTEKWERRFGRVPAMPEIERLLRDAALAQESRVMAYPDGTPWKPLAIYIHFGKKVALMVDETSERVSRVVTFLTAQDQGGMKGEG